MKPADCPLSITLLVVPRFDAAKLTVAPSRLLTSIPPVKVRVVVPPWLPAESWSEDAPPDGKYVGPPATISFRAVSVDAVALAPKKLKVPPARKTSALSFNRPPAFTPLVSSSEICPPSLAATAIALGNPPAAPMSFKLPPEELTVPLSDSALCTLNEPLPVLVKPLD